MTKRARLKKAKQPRSRAQRLRAFVERVLQTIDNGEWHSSVDCRVEKRARECTFCVALRTGARLLAATAD